MFYEHRRIYLNPYAPLPHTLTLGTGWSLEPTQTIQSPTHREVHAKLIGPVRSQSQQTLRNTWDLLCLHVRSYTNPEGQERRSVMVRSALGGGIEHGECEAEGVSATIQQLFETVAMRVRHAVLD